MVDHRGDAAPVIVSGRRHPVNPGAAAWAAAAWRARWGFEARNYEVSMGCADRARLPAVAQADAHKTLVADGFSCREQIRQGSRRETLYVAELLAHAVKEEHR